MATLQTEVGTSFPFLSLFTTGKLILNCNIYGWKINISSDAFSKDIFRLLELTGSAKIGIQVMSQMIASYKQAMPNVPDDFWTELMSEIDEKSLIESVKEFVILTQLEDFADILEELEEDLFEGLRDLDGVEE